MLCFLFFFSFLVFNCVCNNVAEPLVEISHSKVTGESGEMTETQHATCRIITEELVANAEATVTRVLTGVCSAKDMDERFRSLEEELRNRLDDIKEILNSVLNRVGSFESKEDNFPSMVETALPKSNPRQEEIDRFNSTIHNVATPTGRTQVFTYYWRLENMLDKLSHWEPGRSQRSSTFHVGPRGYAMYLRITPRHVPDDRVFLNVGLTRGRYDAAIEWPFPLKHRVEILDQSAEGSREDLSSRIWNPYQLCSGYSWGRPKMSGEADNAECVGLGLARHTILANLSSPSPVRSFEANTRYVWNGSFIIKLTVYL